MKMQLNRMPADAAKGFAGGEIDRARLLSFRLDGRLVSGFAGDTVLSALLASGVDTLGLHLDQPLGLGLRAAPPIALAAMPGEALSMARTPAVDGVEFSVLGQSRGGLMQRLFRPGRTLGMVLDQSEALDRPWRTLPAQPQPETDLVIVGAGVAGLSAALAAARAGLKTVVVEAGLRPGGQSGLFGMQDGESHAEDNMAALTQAAAAEPAITMLCGTKAFALRPGLVRAHRVALRDGKPVGAVIDIACRLVILATGSLERRPIFAGNRLPGVTGSLEAFELARRYGVWPGRSAAIATSSNVAYRLATQASDAGIRIDRVLDSRPQASSRFIEFTRAYGIIQSPGTAPAWAESGKTGAGITIGMSGPGDVSLATGRLIVCGGWQPDLTLWHVAGGSSGWNSATHRLEAVGALDGIALAGSAAGYRTRQGCVQSGADAVDQLLGRKRRPVVDPVIDPGYETPDAPAAVAPVDGSRAAAYLDAGTSLLHVPIARRRAWPGFGRGPDRASLAALAEAPQPLAIGDVAAGVDLGLVPADAAGIVAQERVALVPLTVAAAPPVPTPTAAIVDTYVPDYLAGRFGQGVRVVSIAATSARRLDTGLLLYRSVDAGRPETAIGVVLRSTGSGATALLASEFAADGMVIHAREQGQIIAVTVLPTP